MKRLRSRLARSRPPAEVCVAECGTGGPILGTIHASKGREANRVVLMLPRPRGTRKQTDLDEESRVLYVGATRARIEFNVGDGYSSPASKLEDSGRVYRLSQKSKITAQVEFGRDGDLDPIAHVSDKLFGNARQVAEMQDLLARNAHRTREAYGLSERSWDYMIRLVLVIGESTVRIGQCTKAVNSGLWDIANEIQRKKGLFNLKPPEQVHHLYMFGARTVAISPDHPEIDLVHPPYSRSGLFLAPIIKGFPSVKYGFKSRGRRRGRSWR